jgi:hypothetical protein
MSDSKNPTGNGASRPEPLAEFKARASALRPDPHISSDPGIHLENARAIADLVFVVCGCGKDGSDSDIDELAPNTLSVAMFCLIQEIDTAQELQREIDERERLQRKEESAGG